MTGTANASLSPSTNCGHSCPGFAGGVADPYESYSLGCGTGLGDFGG